MNETQHHRGPDEGALHLEPGLGLGHRRLSIIDLAGGQQPLYNDDKSAVIVYNGEIYNFMALREELQDLGHKFHTSSDTEVVMRGWEQWGEQSVRHFRGMFAFALWDSKKERLFLARDRLGIKPLYYAVLPDRIFLFSSELKALLAYTDMPRELNPYAVEDYFAYGYVPEPKTIFRHAYKLPPGYTLSLGRGEAMPTTKRYWDVSFRSLGHISEEEAQEELLHRLKEAVQIRMIADVPLGAFLSGGVDSSAVVAMMTEVSGEPVNTCSISFRNPKYNEAEFAREVAERFKARHRVDVVEPDDYELVDVLTDLYDEPYADSSAMPTYRVCGLARKEVTVALSGDGGDENLGGYRRYFWHMCEERVRSTTPQSIRKTLFGTLGAIYPKADWAPKVLRAKSTFQALARSSVEGYLHSVSIIPDNLRQQLFSRDFIRELQGYGAIEVLKEHAAAAPCDHPLSWAQYLDLKTYLPGDILTKVDRASMAHSLEVRVPILDHEFVEWLSGLPPALKLQGREGKYVFKKALQRFLPRTVLYRPKMGFAVPLSSWFRGPLREQVRSALLESSLAQTNIFNERTVRRLVDQHQSGLHDHAATLWSLLMFEAFQRKVTQA